MSEPRAGGALAGACLASGVALGLTASHGVFVGTEPAERSLGLLLVAVSTGLQFGLGPVTGALSRHGPRRVVALGALALGAGGATAGLLPTSFGALAYAAGSGIAGACTLTPLLGAVTGWFPSRRTLAVALMLTGSGFGALTLPTVLTWLLEHHSRQAVWTFAGLGGAVLILIGTGSLLPSRVVPMQPQERASTVTVLRKLAGDRFLRRLYLSAVLATAGGAFLPTSFLIPLALERGVERREAAFLLGLLALVTAVSRLVLPAMLVRRWPPYQLYVAAHVALAATYLLWGGTAVVGGFLPVFVIAFGVVIGIWTTLAPVVISDAYPQQAGAALGLLYTAPAVGGLIGPLAGGAVCGLTGDTTWLAVPGCLSLAAAAMTLPRRNHASHGTEPTMKGAHYARACA